MMANKVRLLESIKEHVDPLGEGEVAYIPEGVAGRGLLGVRGKPSWVTDRIAEMMRDQVLMALAEAGYPDAVAHPCGPTPNWYFTGAPRDVIDRAGKLVAASWRVHERGEN